MFKWFSKTRLRYLHSLLNHICAILFPFKRQCPSNFSRYTVSASSGADSSFLFIQVQFLHLFVVNNPILTSCDHSLHKWVIFVVNYKCICDLLNLFPINCEAPKHYSDSCIQDFFKTLQQYGLFLWCPMLYNMDYF